MPGAFYERHVVFDHVVRLQQADPRQQRFGAVAGALRDVLSQRWLKTDATYDRVNPKRNEQHEVHDERRLEQAGALYQQPDAWTRRAILSVAHSGRFSSDRTIMEYARGM